jgi:hypothetical protein
MNTQATVKATANGAAEMYSSLTPNLKRLVGQQFPNELTVTYRVQAGELASPKRNDADSIDNFFHLMEELTGVCRRQFQRGCNSKQLLLLALSNLERK